MTENTSRVHKSIRIKTVTATRVEAQKRPGESDAALYERVILAGLDMLEGKQPAGDPAEPIKERAAAPDHELIEVLKDQIEYLKSQISIKDSQIEALTEVTRAAQTLHAIETTKAIEAPAADQRRGFLSRLFRR